MDMKGERMSILIRGMEMPKNCEECLFFESKYCYHGCLAKPESINNMDMWDFEVGSRPPSWCPLTEQKTGKWLRTPTAWVYCSVCGKEPPEETNATTPFCPNCGAEMTNYRPTVFTTNADRIRAMTDEELAMHIGCVHIGEWCPHLDDDIECMDCRLEWLKKEVKDD